jgi:type I restriction enzyme, S subunit
MKFTPGFQKLRKTVLKKGMEKTRTNFKETEIGPIPEEWEVFHLEDVMERIIDYRGKTPVKTTSGVPLVTAKVIKNGRIDFSNPEHISEEDYDAWMRRGMPNPGDVVITTEAPLGEVAQLPNSKIALAQRVITLRGKKDVLDNSYLKYYFLSSIGAGQLKTKETGSVVTGIKQSELRKTNILVPPLDEQKRIAEILSSLDETIKLNRKMNKTLEEIAQALFKQWFVDFEFPVSPTPPAGGGEGGGGRGYKSSGGKMIDSDLGPIPEGWRVSDIGDVVNIVYGKGLPTDKLSQVGYPVFGGNGVIGFYSEYIYEEPQVVIGCRGAGSGNIRQTYPKSFVTNNSLVLESTSNSTIDRFYLKHFLHTIDISGFVTGSAQPQITIANLCRLNFLIPEKKLLDIFKDNLLGIDCIQTENELEIQRLSVIRDSLLPRLMSGKIRTNS